MQPDTQRKIRVLFLLEALYPRGAERVSLSLASQLDRTQFEPHIWILRSTYNDLLGEIPPDVQPHIALRPNERIRHQIWRVPRDLLREAARADVIVGTVELMPTYFGFFAGVLTGRPVVGWVRNSLDRVLGQLSPLHTWLGRLIYTRLPRVVFVSHGLKHTLTGMFPLREERLTVIHNPLDLNRVRALAQEPLPEWAAFMTRRPTVLGVGRLTKQKGFNYLIEAHASLLARGVEHDLLILGDDPQERQALRDLARRLGVEESVHMPGHAANPYPFMRHAAVFALSSRYEGFANVITEAMACGAPVVSTDCPSGPGEILEGGRHGLLVPVEDSGALAQALGTVLEDGALRERLREAGLRRAQDFAPEQVVPRWEAVLRAAARPAAGRRRRGAGELRT